MAYKPVDTDIKVVVGPCIDDTDFKTREMGIAPDAKGMDLSVIFETHDGEIITTSINPTVDGAHKWSHRGQGYYQLELPGIGGDYNNVESGVLRVVGYCEGVLPFSSVSYDVVPQKIYNSFVKGASDFVQARPYDSETGRRKEG